MSPNDFRLGISLTKVDPPEINFRLSVEPHGQARQNNGGQARGTTLFRRFASRTAGLSGATSRSSAHSSTAKAVALCERGKLENR